MSKHIVDRFDFETICAGVLRMIVDPASYNKYNRYIDPEWIFRNDSNPAAEALRGVAELMIYLRSEKRNEPISFHEFLSNIPIYYKNEKAEALRQHFLTWINNPSISEKVKDDGVFQVFIKFLQTTRLAKSFIPFSDKYQKGQVMDAADIMNRALIEISQMGATKADTVQDEDFEELFGENIDKYTGEYRIFRIGNAGIDAAIGGFERQTLNLFISVTNGGKSMMAHHILRRCVEDNVPVYISVLEDRKSSFLYKLMAAITGIHVNKLRNRRNELTASEQQSVKDAIKKIKELIKINFIYDENIDSVHQLALEYDMECRMTGRPVPIINIVDYTGHIAARSQGEKGFEKMRNAYAARKDFCLKNDKIGFDFAQVNREGGKRLQEDKVLTQNDLAGAYDLSQVADNIISINRNSVDVTESKVRLHICKARDGIVGLTARMTTNFACARYEMVEGVSYEGPHELIRELKGGY